MKYIKKYENWIKNLLINLDYNENRFISDEKIQKLKDLGFVSSDSTTFEYNSFLTPKKIIIKNKYKPAPELDPGKDIHKVIIIDNNKKEIKWFEKFDDMIKYLEDITPEYSIKTKYNL